MIELTDKEKRIVKSLSEGFSHPEIARAEGTHTSEITLILLSCVEKNGLKNTTQLVADCLRSEIIT